MKRLVWLTDIHLNFLKELQVEEFCRTVAAAEPDSVLIGAILVRHQTSKRTFACLNGI